MDLSRLLPGNEGLRLQADLRIPLEKINQHQTHHGILSDRLRNLLASNGYDLYYPFYVRLYQDRKVTNKGHLCIMECAMECALIPGDYLPKIQWEEAQRFVKDYIYMGILPHSKLSRTGIYTIIEEGVSKKDSTSAHPQ